jgi:hypothetical protein
MRPVLPALTGIKYSQQRQLNAQSKAKMRTARRLKWTISTGK